MAFINRLGVLILMFFCVSGVSLDRFYTVEGHNVNVGVKAHCLVCKPRAVHKFVLERDVG